jgi:DNA-binding transcriptional MerR regulator
MLSATARPGLSVAWSGPSAGPLDRRLASPDTRHMEDLTEREIDELLEKLEADERDISTTRRRLHDRIATFPETAARAHLEQREEELSKERRELHRRIDELRVRRDELGSQRAG